MDLDDVGHGHTFEDQLRHTVTDLDCMSTNHGPGVTQAPHEPQTAKQDTLKVLVRMVEQ